MATQKEQTKTPASLPNQKKKDAAPKKKQQTTTTPPAFSHAARPSKKIQGKSRKAALSRLTTAITALLVAFGIWYYVSIYDRVEMQIDVFLTYQNIPKDLVVTSGLIDKMTARIIGPSTLMDMANQKPVRRSIDLSFIKPGRNQRPFATPEYGTMRAFDVVDFQPTKLSLTVETIVERSVKVAPVIKTNLLDVEDVRIKPENVTLRGPKSVISKISSISLPVHPNTTEEKALFSDDLTLDTPSLVTASPPSVRVSYKVTGGRKTLTRKYPVNILVHNPQEYQVNPASVSLSINVPNRLASSEKYLSGLSASVVPPNIEPGRSDTASVRYILPDGMKLVPPYPQEVTITRNVSEATEEDDEEDESKVHSPKRPSWPSGIKIIEP